MGSQIESPSGEPWLRALSGQLGWLPQSQGKRGGS
jgi:hypothetical protein